MSWELSFASASSCQAVPTPTYSYAAFSYTPMSTVRYATPVPSPLVYSAPWAPAFTDASTLLPSNVTYTTYTLEPNVTYTSEANAYGQSAYAALWSSYTFSSTVPWSTTVSPTPVASSELIYPPPLYNRPTEADCLRFPSDFVWGVAGSSWQIEGGLQSEGRGPSLLDSTGALPNTRGVNDSVTGNMNYFLYKQDIARLAAIGMPYYSFSISWSRVVPFGKAGTPVNTQALDHYDELINTCLEYGVTPLVTLNHFDSPAGVNFTDPAMVDDFMYYSKQVATRYADRVPVWFTFNEPNLVAQFFFPFQAVTNMLLAHARFYRWYRDELGGRAQITMKFANNLALPLGGPDNAADVQGALRYQDFILGTMSNPLFLGQQYPDSVLDTPNIGLTALTEEEIALINGTADFWAFDPYVSQFAAAVHDYDTCLTNAAHPAFPYCVELTAVQADGWAMGAKSNSYSYVAPQGVRQQLLYVWDTFRPSGVMATEFGFPIHREAEMDPVDQRYDLLRTLYYQNFLTEMLKSRYEDGVNVIGALAWSVADNNEFGSFKEQYGLQTVNRTDGRWTRQYKRSMFDYVDFMRAHVGE